MHDQTVLRDRAIVDTGSTGTVPLNLAAVDGSCRRAHRKVLTGVLLLDGQLDRAVLGGDTGPLLDRIVRLFVSLQGRFVV